LLINVHYDFIHYIIKYEFATNNNPGVSQDVDLFLPPELICLREYKQCCKQCLKWWVHLLPWWPCDW